MCEICKAATVLDPESATELIEIYQRLTQEPAPQKTKKKRVVSPVLPLLSDRIKQLCSFKSRSQDLNSQAGKYSRSSQRKETPSTVMHILRSSFLIIVLRANALLFVQNALLTDLIRGTKSSL